MIKAVNKRVEKNNLREIAGEFYRGKDSELVKSISNSDEEAFVGIQNNEGMYTVVGEKHLYYCSQSHNKGKIVINEVIKTFQKNAMNLGKGGDFEFIELENGDNLWVVNGKVMCAIWNIIKLFENKH